MKMKKEELLRRVGSMDQVAYARRIQYREGRAAGMRAVQAVCGPLSFVVMEDKALDICEASYYGTPIHFLAKTGLMGRGAYDTHGLEAQRSIMGGMVFTCGLENICAPYAAAGKEYPMHGRMRTTPAEHVCADCRWEDGCYCITISGEMREAELFGENMVIRRTIRAVYGEDSITITDQVINDSFRPEPAMLMYHCNFGYPFLQEGCRILLPTQAVTPRDEASAPYTGQYGRMDGPVDNAPEQVFLHQLRAGPEGDTFAAVINDETLQAVRISFNRRQLPYFMEWKSTASGDYALGLEPANSSVYGRGFHEQAGTLHHLGPQESETYTVRLSFFQGRQAISQLEDQYQDVMKETTP